jgi:hypothetical protein
MIHNPHRSSWYKNLLPELQSRKRGNEYPHLKSYVRNINLILMGFLASVDLAYYLNSRVMAWISFILLVSLAFVPFKDGERIIYNGLKIGSEKPCDRITVRSLLLSKKSDSCLIELARRTSVSFAITVYYLLIVAVLIPIFSVLLFIFFWTEGVLYFISISEIFGYSLLIAAVIPVSTVYPLRKNLLRIRAQELSESNPS